jgi:hypothetical protein
MMITPRGDTYVQGVGDKQMDDRRYGGGLVCNWVAFTGSAVGGLG